MKTEKWYRAIKEAVSKAQKGRKHQPQEGFQKGHKPFAGTEKTRFKKGHTAYCPPEKRFKKHGMSGTKFYRTWLSMRQRCNNPKSVQYKDYGGRGIKVKWEDFNEFKKDMYKSFQEHIEEFGEKQTTIDRIDNWDDYSKDNCRWSTYKEQLRNRRNNHLLTYNGRTQCFSDWAEEIGICRTGLWKRLKKMTVEEALTKKAVTK